MSTQPLSGAVATARNFYNSNDADAFYLQVWGGEDIHIGLYEDEHETIRDASQRTVARMASRLGKRLNAGARVLDFGGGYGGAARFLARNFNASVISLNLSEVENLRARELNREAALDGLIDIVDGNFEQAPFQDQSVDIVWSQEAFLHSGDKLQVLREVARLLKPGGMLIFTDPMQSDHCPEEVLQPVLERIKLDSLASPEFYRRELQALGFCQFQFDDMSGQLVTHYSRVREELHQRYQALSKTISTEFLDNMIRGLGHWVEAGQAGQLCWGITSAQKQ